MDGDSNAAKVEEVRAILKQIEEEAKIARELTKNFCTKRRLLDAINSKRKILCEDSCDGPIFIKPCVLHFFGGSVVAYADPRMIEDRAMFFPKDPRYTINYL